MDIHINTNPSPEAALDFLEAVRLNNEALALGNSGDHAGAERMHKKALELKEHTHGPNSIQAALSRNALGEVQALQDKFEEAEVNLRRAVAIRNTSGSAFDAAVSRENLAQVLEAKGMFSEAKETRDFGRPNKISCGNYHVSVISFSSLVSHCQHLVC
jgi:Flp pilus assembly protein TadD